MGPSELAWRCARAALRAIEEAARVAYPEEACGWLVGAAGDVMQAVPVSNEAGTARTLRYLMGPSSYRDASEQAQQDGLEIVGVFHSHPDHPPRPSASDLAEAWPSWLYVIVPVMAGTPGEPHAWLLRDDRSGFIEARLAIVE